MKAVVQLLLTYFAGTAFGRRVSAAAVVLLAITFVSRLLNPDFGWMFQTGDLADVSPAVGFLIGAVPVLAIFGLFFGTFMLPVVLGQLSTTRRLHALPHGRIGVIVSALICVVLVALAYTAVFALYVPAVFRNDLQTFTGALAGYTLLYIVLWLVLRSRTVFGKLASGMLLIAALAAPAVIGPRTGALARLAVTLVLWAAIALWVGRARRTDGLGRRLSASLARLRRALGARAGLDEQRRIDALVGTASPWLAALGPVVPFAIAMLFVRTPSGWLFYLTLFAALSGAIASFAARRSRTLWLRTRWSRAEIFARLERAFWRQNGCALATLALAHVAISVSFSLPLRSALLGVALLGLAMAASTYLGFMMTRRIRGTEIALTLVTMLLVMTAAVSVSDVATDSAWIAAQMIMLAAAVLAFRAAARRRWHDIDWSLTNAQPESG